MIFYKYLSSNRKLIITSDCNLGMKNDFDREHERALN